MQAYGDLHEKPTHPGEPRKKEPLLNLVVSGKQTASTRAAGSPVSAHRLWQDSHLRAGIPANDQGRDRARGGQDGHLHGANEGARSNLNETSLILIRNQALCTERFNDWKVRFQHLAVCRSRPPHQYVRLTRPGAEITGDTSDFNETLKALSSANLIVTTVSDDGRLESRPALSPTTAGEVGLGHPSFEQYARHRGSTGSDDDRRGELLVPSQPPR